MTVPDFLVLAYSAQLIERGMAGVAGLLEGATHCHLPTSQRGALADARAQAIVQRDRINLLIVELGGE
jgi:hypothetical protein